MENFTIDINKEDEFIKNLNKEINDTSSESDSEKTNIDNEDKSKYNELEILKSNNKKRSIE